MYVDVGKFGDKVKFGKLGWCSIIAYSDTTLRNIRLLECV